MSRRVMTAAAIGLAVVVGALWWTWPTLTGESDEVDVVVAVDEQLAVAEESLVERIRENGDLVDLVEVDDWCVDPAGLLGAGADRIVVPFDGDVGCVESLVDAASVPVLVLVRPGQDPSGISATGAVVVDPTPLLGAPGEAVPCQWWEECPDGSVVPVAADGALTVIGGERIARRLVADL